MEEIPLLLVYADAFDKLCGHNMYLDDHTKRTPEWFIDDSIYSRSEDRCEPRCDVMLPARNKAGDT